MNPGKISVVNRYGRSWNIPNLFIVGSSKFPSMGAGFNPTLTIQALAFMSADVIVKRYKTRPIANTPIKQPANFRIADQSSTVKTGNWTRNVSTHLTGRR